MDPVDYTYKQLKMKRRRKMKRLGFAMALNKLINGEETEEEHNPLELTVSVLSDSDSESESGDGEGDEEGDKEGENENILKSEEDSTKEVDKKNGSVAEEDGLPKEDEVDLDGESNGNSSGKSNAQENDNQNEQEEGQTKKQNDNSTEPIGSTKNSNHGNDEPKSNEECNSIGEAETSEQANKKSKPKDSEPKKKITMDSDRTIKQTEGEGNNIHPQTQTTLASDFDDSKSNLSLTEKSLEASPIKANNQVESSSKKESEPESKFTGVKKIFKSLFLPKKQENPSIADSSSLSKSQMAPKFTSDGIFVPKKYRN